MFCYTDFLQTLQMLEEAFGGSEENAHLQVA
jgi:hypothetical protein